MSLKPILFPAQPLNFGKLPPEPKRTLNHRSHRLSSRLVVTRKPHFIWKDRRSACLNIQNSSTWEVNVIKLFLERWRCENGPSWRDDAWHPTITHTAAGVYISAGNNRCQDHLKIVGTMFLPSKPVWTYPPPTCLSACCTPSVHSTQLRAWSQEIKT